RLAIAMKAAPSPAENARCTPIPAHNDMDAKSEVDEPIPIVSAMDSGKAHTLVVNDPATISMMRKAAPAMSPGSSQRCAASALPLWGPLRAVAFMRPSVERSRRKHVTRADGVAYTRGMIFGGDHPLDVGQSLAQSGSEASLRGRAFETANGCKYERITALVAFAATGGPPRDRLFLPTARASRAA